MGLRLYVRLIASAAFVILYGSVGLPEEVQERLVFTGDIMLSREVQREIEQKHNVSPWVGMQNYFSNSDMVLGNLEGSVGAKKNCINQSNPLCFATDARTLHFIKEAGFTAMGVENNHSADLGASGREATIAALQSESIKSIDFTNSPIFFRIGSDTFAIIALNNVKGADGKMVEIPSPLLRQKIQLARALANWVIVYVHWGVELADWAQPKQREMAEWLTLQGADLVVGSHPHVVENVECINGKPVFFSLGNHVFDQKYPETKEGMIADCNVSSGKLSCSSKATHTAAGSAFPTIQAENVSSNSLALEACAVTRHTPINVNGYSFRPRLENHQFTNGDIILEGMKDGAIAWDIIAKRILSLETALFQVDGASKEFLFSLEQHHSTIDKEVGPRPYVYEVTPQGLVAKWRGSALAWPLIDARMMLSKQGIDYLCALHRKDSFLMLNPDSTETRTTVYQWNGFGFSSVPDKKLNESCRDLYSSSAP